MFRLMTSTHFMGGGAAFITRVGFEIQWPIRLKIGDGCRDTTRRGKMYCQPDLPFPFWCDPSGSHTDRLYPWVFADRIWCASGLGCSGDIPSIGDGVPRNAQSAQTLSLEDIPLIEEDVPRIVHPGQSESQ